MTISKIVKWLLITTGGALIILALLFIYSFWYMRTGVFNTTPFNPTEWKAPITNVNNTLCYRGGMANDIRDNVLSRKTTINDMMTLLGKPDRSISKNAYEYELGMCSGFQMDHDSLTIYFNSRGQFSHADIIQH
jgi:hypothetical protein